MKILRVVALRSASGAYGGPADTALNQARLVAQFGHDVTVLSGILPEDRPTQAPPPGVRLIEVPARSWVKRLPMASLASIALLSAIWKEVGKAQVVHVSFAREFTAVMTAIACILRRRSFVLQPHGMLTARKGRLQALLDPLVKPLLRRSGSVIALTGKESRDLIEWSSGHHPNIIEVGNPPLQGTQDIPHINTDRRSYREALFLARLEPRKRVEVFAAASILARQRGSDIQYRIVGPDQGDLKSITYILRESDNLRYEGSIPADRVAERLAMSSVFVLCSANEPWGNVLVTAIEMGVPVVVTESAALSELILTYEAGRVVPDGDSEAIVAAIENLISDPSSYSHAQAGAERMASEWLSVDAIVRGLLEAYEAARRRHNRS